MTSEKLVALALLSLLAHACGDDDASEAPETETVEEAPAPEGDRTPPADESESARPGAERQEEQDEHEGQEGVTGPAPTADAEPPVLDSAEAIHAALLSARPSAPAVWALTDPEHGLELDFHWVMTHFAHTACTEEELVTWQGWAREDGLRVYRLAQGDPFHCTEDLSMCASCPQDISLCERGTVFELGTNREGRRYLRGVIMAPARSEALWDLVPTTLEGARRARADLGAASETGVKCAIRSKLLSGEVDALWVEHVPATGARTARQLEGDEAREFTRELGGRFGLSAYCGAERCVVQGDGELFGVYFRRARRRRRRPPSSPTVSVVTHGPAQCESCAPEPSRDVIRRARRRGRRR
jgi:hypothetical protein